MWLFIGSTFYTSLLFKKAPGTISSLAVFLFFFYLNPLALSYKLGFAAVIGFSHFLCFPSFKRAHKNEDPSLYTLDETFAIVLLNIFFYTTKEWIAAFILFRFFDILKPLGIKRFENMKAIPSSIRNIGDDIIAAFYTSLLIAGYRYV